jgi:ribA/ribD-fused uncharacterized protein
MTIYFYGENNLYGEFSNFHQSEFQVCARDIFSDEEIESELVDKTVTVYTSEQAIMWMKAVLMNDSQTAVLIENAKSPKECKRLGRKVTPFDDDKWKLWRENVAVYVLTKKFSSSAHLFSVLQSTKGQDIAEASRNDSIWGIGIDETKALKGIKWQGKNILGKALMTVRANMENFDHYSMGT